jgi:putative ABC transport system permease protein
VFYIRYIASELRRRRGRTILTALGLGIGVGLVVTVSALSSGLDAAQSKVLEPLTGVGTDMSVSRPIIVSGSGSSQTFTPGQGPPELSAREQRELQRENGGGRFDISKLGKPGHHFSTTQFRTTDLSFPERQAKRTGSLAGVDGAAGALTLDMVHLSGIVPKSSSSSGTAVFGGPGAGAPPGGAQGGNLNFEPISVTGIDTSRPDLGLVTPSQIVKGRYLGGDERGQRAVLSQTYADGNNLGVGDHVDVGGKRFRVVGLPPSRSAASPPRSTSRSGSSRSSPIASGASMRSRFERRAPARSPPRRPRSSARSRDRRSPPRPTSRSGSPDRSSTPRT